VTPADVHQVQFPPKPKKAEIHKEVNAYLKAAISEPQRVQKNVPLHARHGLDKIRLKHS
jgi:hypothetical protein